MKAVEFETEVINNTISIPESYRHELSISKDQHVRVIVLIDNIADEEDRAFKSMIQNQFLKGYDDSDSVYDTL